MSQWSIDDRGNGMSRKSRKEAQPVKTIYADPDHERDSFLTLGGNRIDLKSPQPKDVEFAEIANSISRTCRYTGQTKYHYSVAEHSLRCLWLAERWIGPQLTHPLRIAILLHDCHEAFIGDMSRPLFATLSREGRDDIGELRIAWDKVIAAKAGIEHLLFIHELVRMVDKQMMMIEKWHMWPAVCRKWECPVALQHAQPLSFWSAGLAADRWLKRCVDLIAKGM